MWKIHALAALISLVLTGLTLWILPKIYYASVAWYATLDESTAQQFHWVQAGLGFLLAIVVGWRWYKRKQTKK